MRPWMREATPAGFFARLMATGADLIAWASVGKGLAPTVLEGQIGMARAAGAGAAQDLARARVVGDQLPHMAPGGDRARPRWRRRYAR